MTIYFMGTKAVPYGCFSNFSKHGFELDGKRWATSEHYFQAQKFINTEYYNQICAAKTPKQAANLGRSRKLPLRADWERAKEDAMRRALYAKFTTHANLKQILLSSGSEDIVEKTTGDYYWGCGKNGTGSNRLGMLLMELRAKLRRDNKDGVVSNIHETADSHKADALQPQGSVAVTPVPDIPCPKCFMRFKGEKGLMTHSRFCGKPKTSL